MTWHHFLWYHWEIRVSAWWPFLGNTAQKNAAFWTPLLGEGPSNLLLTSSLFLQNNFRKERQIPNSLIKTINTFFLYFKNSNRCLLGFFRSMQNIYLHEEMPSSVWETHLVRTYYCCAQEHLLLIKGVTAQFAKQSACTNVFLPCAFWSLFPTWVFQVQNGLHSEERPICVSLMLRGIKLCRRELISVLLLSCLDAGVGFVALPSKLAEAAGPCKIVLICDWSGSPLLLSCRSIFILCMNFSLSEKYHLSCRQRQQKRYVLWCFSHKVQGTAFQPLPSVGLLRSKQNWRTERNNAQRRRIFWMPLLMPL